MRHFKDKIIVFLIVVPPALIVLTLTIFFGFLSLPMVIMNLLKIIWIILFIGLIIFVRLRFWTYRPRSMKGQFDGLNWVANIKYDKSRRAINAEINWLCPKHKTLLQLKDSETSNTSYSTLFCTKCNKTYDLKLKNDVVSPQEAQIAIKQDILSEVGISEFNKIL